MIIAGYVVYSDAALRSATTSLRVSRAGDVDASAVRRFVLSGVALFKVRRKGDRVKGKTRGNCKELLHKIFREKWFRKDLLFRFKVSVDLGGGSL
jgi:hypothetical protein